MAWIALGAAFGLSLVLVPAVRAWSLRTGRVARPREDRWHRKPTAMLGGAGFFLAFLLSLLLFGLVSGGWEEIPWGLLAGSAVVFLLGLVDDLKQISPPAKLVGQILAAAVVIALGYTTQFFSPRIENTVVAQLPNILVTFFWLVGITNAINLIDNMDGLAGGISLITALFLSYFFWESGSLGLLGVSLALAGAVLGFLVFNFPPASIFMGDSGSLFLGFTLAGLAIARQPQASNVFAVMGVPTLLFLLPILDTALVTFTRLLRGQSPAQGGRDHTSHRLIAFGLNERQALLALYAAALVSGVMAAALESIQYWFSLVIVPFLVLSLTLLTAYLGGIRVVPAGSAPPKRGIFRALLEMTYRRRILEILFDFALIGLAYYLAFFTRFGFAMNDGTLGLYLQSLPAAYFASYTVFYLAGVYRGMWRYTGLEELVRFFTAAVGSALVLGLSARLLYPQEPYPEILFFTFAVYLFLALAAARFSFRLLDKISSSRTQAPGGERVVICGAGDAGELALRWILMNPQFGFRPVAILDGDPLKTGREIHGVEITGGYEQIEATLARCRPAGLILTPDGDEPPGFGERAIEAARRQGCWVRRMKLEFEPVDG